MKKLASLLTINDIVPTSEFRILFANIGVVIRDIAIGAGGLGFDSWAGQIGHLFLFCPETKSRRQAPPLVARFGV